MELLTQGLLYMFNVNDGSYQIGTFLFYQIQLRVMQNLYLKCQYSLLRWI